MISNEHIETQGEPLVDCPACGLPAEIIDRFTLGGAPGPVEHVKVVCVARHWFTLPLDLLAVRPESEGPGDEAACAPVRDLRNIP